MDGTLINSLDDLADSVNETMDYYNFPNHSLEEYRYFVGNGAKKLIRRSVPSEKTDDENFISEVLAYYDNCYRKRLTNKTQPYDGIVEALNKLKALNIPIGVCTNKQQFAADEIVEKMFPAKIFDAVIGDQKGLPRKPDPKKVLMIAEQFKIDPSNVAYFGDTSVDMETAHNAGFFSVGVTWGFRPKSELIESGAEFLIDHPKEILQLFRAY
ncbi:MAG: HAD family hydrolase [Selenomonadaceae bacterium]|nr:HAD family hydrolase [Selenomonadaceae bacterium]